jgi:hypothetical protein
VLASCTVFAFDGRAFLERMIAGRLGLEGKAHVRIVSRYQACRLVRSRLSLVRLYRMKLRGLYVHSALAHPGEAGQRPGQRCYTAGSRATWRRTLTRVAGRSLKWLKVKVPKYREEERGFYKPE